MRALASSEIGHCFPTPRTGCTLLYPLATPHNGVSHTCSIDTYTTDRFIHTREVASLSQSKGETRQAGQQTMYIPRFRLGENQQLRDEFKAI